MRLIQKDTSMDKLSQNKRSWNMSRIKGKDTSIEIEVRKYLYHHGFRYRKNVKELPGKPDIVLYKYRTVIFINGCFWHHHPHCRLAYIPKSRTAYWMKKFNDNMERDIEKQKQLESMDYKVITVWECELKDCFDYRMQKLVEEILDGSYEK